MGPNNLEQGSDGAFVKWLWVKRIRGAEKLQEVDWAEMGQKKKRAHSCVELRLALNLDLSYFKDLDCLGACKFHALRL